MWLTSPTPVSVMTGALWFTRCSGLSQAPLRAASPCVWPALCWLAVTARQELALRSRAGPETPTALPFAQTAWDSLVLVSVSQHTLKRCNKASASVTAIHEKALKSESVSRLVLSNSLWPHRLYPTRLLCPWDFPGKNKGMGCRFLLQGIFPTQGLNSSLLHWQVVTLPLSQQGSPLGSSTFITESSFVYVCLCEWNGLFFN